MRWKSPPRGIEHLPQRAASAAAFAAGMAASAIALGCTARSEVPSGATAVPATSGTASASASDAAVATDASLPPPACEEEADGGAWERAVPGAAGIAKTVAGTGGRTLGGLTQTLATKGTMRLRFLGTHVFDLLDKVEMEGGATQGERRRVICAVLSEASRRGASVVRLWGSLKRTGSTGAIERALDTLLLVLDENARRARPLRFVVSLLNHQPGYGLPDPEVSLDDQKAAGWSAREVYLEGTWERRGIGQLAERIERYADETAIRTSPYVLAWELVNELDTHRSVANGSFSGPAADKLKTTFLVPAATMLASRFSQPIAIGEVRGALASYADFATGVISALPADARARLVWTTHVYVETSATITAAERAALVEKGTRKLDVDLDLARKLGLPLLVGEIGQHVRDAKTAYCQGGAAHDVPALLAGVLAPEPDPRGRRDIEMALFWGEGMCGLTIDAATGRQINVGAGGDSADLGPGETAAREALRGARRWPRFVLR